MVWQKDLGAAALFFILYVVIAYMYSRSKWILLGQLAAASAAAGLSVFLFSHVRVRIIGWLFPVEHALDEGYQLMRAMSALLRGRWWGTGLGLGMPERIPVVSSDLLFAAIAEEYGAVYFLIFVLHFLFLILLLYTQCQKAKNKFYFYVGTGLTTMLAVQGFLIMAGGSGLIPLTGVVLPFVSYGGSAMLGNFAAVGMIEALSKCPAMENDGGKAAVQTAELYKYVRILKGLCFFMYTVFLLYLMWFYWFRADLIFSNY